MDTKNKKNPITSFSFLTKENHKDNTEELNENQTENQSENQSENQTETQNDKSKLPVTSSSIRCRY